MAVHAQVKLIMTCVIAKTIYEHIPKNLVLDLVSQSQTENHTGNTSKAVST